MIERGDVEFGKDGSEVEFKCTENGEMDGDFGGGVESEGLERGDMSVGGESGEGWEGVGGVVIAASSSSFCANGQGDGDGCFGREDKLFVEAASQFLAK